MSDPTPSNHDRDASPLPGHDLGEQSGGGSFDQLLNETLTVFGSCPPELLDRIRQVVHRHAGQELSLDPVVTELVDTILHFRLLAIGPHEAFWQSEPRRIASTLIEDPISHRKLREFWSQAVEALT